MRVGVVSRGPNTFKSTIWQFSVEIRNGEKVKDETQMICEHSKKTIPCTEANTSSE